MFIHPEYKGTLEELMEEVENALIDFENDKEKNPIDEKDKSNWL